MRHLKTTSSDPALLVGLETPDDAGVYRLAPDLAMVQTVDFFTPVVDDPYDWGRIAAANALSDIYAMGGRPVTALNLVGWPRSLDFALLGRVLEGGQAITDEAGVSIIGGHSIDDAEPKFGLAVTGLVHPDRIVATHGAGSGSDLVLTKPLGVGIVSSAIKSGRVSADTIRLAIASMTFLNRAASEVMLQHGVRHATDVTGFGLSGHLLEMLGDRLSATLEWAEIPVFDEALELAGRGVLPAGTKRNEEAARGRVSAPGLTEAQSWLLFDAQTSGGLLMAVPPERTAALLADLTERGVRRARRIGSLQEGDGKIEVRG
jgi:selenide,water dikinase